MKASFILSAVLVCVSLCFADLFDKPVNGAQKNLLAFALSQMTAHELIMGDFKQTKTIKKLNRDFISTGRFAILKDGGVLWRTQKPFASDLFVAENSLTQFDAKGNAKQIAASENPIFAEFSKTIQSVFSGDLSAMMVNFTVYFEASDKIRVGLVPKEAAVQKVIANIVLEGSTNLDRVIITDGEGNPVVYEFSNHRQFQWNKKYPKNYESLKLML